MRVSGVAAALLVLCGCVPQRKVGGTLQGLDPTLGTVKLNLNNEQSVTLEKDGTFTFEKTLAEGTKYAATFDGTPARQDCVISGEAGVVPQGRDAMTLKVTCALKKYGVGGTLTGVDKPGLSLTELTSDQTTSPGVGQASFAFALPLEYRQSYVVVMATRPAGRDCFVDGGSGDVTDVVHSVAVSCVPQRFPLGGEVTGLDAGVVVLAESATQQQLAVDGGGPFTFPAPVEWGTAVNVTIAQQPAASFCRVDAGAGEVKSAKRDVDVACKAGSPLGGFADGIEGTPLVLRELTTGQLLSIVPDAGLVDFTFAGVVPDGEPYTVAVETAPFGEVCRVANATGTMAGPRHDVEVTCAYGYPDLVVSELAASPAPGVPAWVELYNGTPAAKNLADYVVRGEVVLGDGGAVLPPADFALPDASVPAFGFVVLSGKPIADLYRGPQLELLGGPAASFYFAADGGSAGVQLRRAADGVVVDAVAFAPSDAGWSGAAAVLPTGLGQVLARRLSRADTNRAGDFAVAEVATPGGPNDAFDAVDLDQDGLPDSAERPGGKLAGLPLYAWGARTSQRDVFVEIDWMKPDGGTAGFDPGILPRKDAIDRVAGVLGAHGIVLHADVGPIAYDLGGGNEVPFGCTLTMVGTPGPTSFYAVKAQHFDLRRRASFHYAVFGNSLADVACGGVGATGRSDLPGNDLAITLGNRGYTTAPATQANRLVNVMSSTLLHELGHNFGLRHGGDDDVNFKPNYLSAMNYLYQLEGLPEIGNAEGDRYYYVYSLYGLCTGAPAITTRNNLTRNVFSPPAQFALDFSDGGSAPLNQAAMDETKGMGRVGSTAVDWNYDGTIQMTAVSANVNPLGAVAVPVCPRGTTATGVVSDFDDWAAISLPFQHSIGGASSGAKRKTGRAPRAIDVVGDHQRQADETATFP